MATDYEILVLCQEVRRKKLPVKYQCLTGTIAYEDVIGDKKCLIVPFSSWSKGQFSLKISSLLLQHRSLKKIILFNEGDKVCLIKKCYSPGKKCRTMRGSEKLDFSEKPDFSEKICIENSEDSKAGKLTYDFYQTIEFLVPMKEAYSFLIKNDEFCDKILSKFC